MTAVIRFDATPIRLGATPIDERPGGFKVYRGVAAYGDVVLEYGPGDPGGQRTEFVPASTALDPETLRLTEGIPFTIVHPDDMLDAADEDAIREHAEGAVLKATANWQADPPELVVDVIVHTASAQQAIESGQTRELSLGYECDDEVRGGVHGGTAYQVVQVKRRPNHLSGVRRARSGTRDGRRARLDGRAAGGSYPREDMPFDPLDPLAPPETPARLVDPLDPEGEAEAAAASAARRDEESMGVAPMDAPPPPGAEAEVPAADPAVVLAAFGPEDAEVLKGLSPEGLALLVAAMGKSVEVEIDDAAATNEQAPAADPATAPADATDASTPMAPVGAVTMDQVKQMIADAFAANLDALKAGLAPAKKSDAAPTATVPRTLAPADPARIARETVRADAEFVGKVRRAGYRVDAVQSAADAAQAVIDEHAPALKAISRKAYRDGRRDDFIACFDAAEDRRRDSLIGEQEDAIAILHHELAGQPSAGTFRASFTLPDSATSGA